MGAKLNDLGRNTGSSVYNNSAYMNYMSSHLKWLREHVTTDTILLDKTVVHKNLNDFIGLFIDLGIRYEDHLIMMLVNNYLDPFGLTEEVETLLVPNNQVIDQLKLIFRTITV
jgi:hypothetical protein